MEYQPSEFVADLSARRKRHGLFWTVIVIGTLLVLAIGTPLGFLKYSETRVFGKMTPQQKAEFEVWYTKKIAIPPELLEAKPFAPETVAAVAEFHLLCDEMADPMRSVLDDWHGVGNGYGYLASVSGEEFLTRRRDDLRSLEPLLAAFRAVVRCPDYTLEVWRGARDLEKVTSYNEAMGYRGQDAVTQFQVVRLCHLDALVCLGEDRLPEAGAAADALVAFAQTDPCSSFIDKMMGVLMLKQGLQISPTIAEKMTDPEEKKALLSSLEAHRARTRFDTDPPLPLDTLDRISTARYARRLGVVADLQDRTAYEMLKESIWVLMEYDRKFSSVSMAADPKLRKEMERDTRSVREFHENRNSRTPRPAGLKGYFIGWTERAFAASMYSITNPNLSGKKQKMDAVLKQYDDLIASLSDGTLPPTIPAEAAPE